jgi:hypothetical protein
MVVNQKTIHAQKQTVYIFILTICLFKKKVIIIHGIFDMYYCQEGFWHYA